MAQRLKLGHFVASRWRVGQPQRAEVEGARPDYLPIRARQPVDPKDAVGAANG